MILVRALYGYVEAQACKGVLMLLALKSQRGEKEVSVILRYHL